MSVAEPPLSFYDCIRVEINKHGIDSELNIPDYVLAEYYWKLLETLNEFKRL